MTDSVTSVLSNFFVLNNKILKIHKLNLYHIIWLMTKLGLNSEVEKGFLSLPCPRLVGIMMRSE